MNKLFFSFSLLVAATVLLGSENTILDWAKDEIKTGNGFIDEAVDIATDKATDKVRHKSKDSNWFHLGGKTKEMQLDGSIDRFFNKFNNSNPISEPFEIHFLGGKATPSAPFLELDSTSVYLPELTREDRPIDYKNGGLLAAQNLEDALKNAVHGETYRYLVALETTSPLLASAVKQIQTWGNQLNAMSIHSYDMAAALVPGMWPKIQRGASFACEHELIAKGKDLIEARTLCQGKKKREEELRKLAERNEQAFVGSFNVAEKILSQMGIGKAKELFMNMTGTLVVNNGQISYYPPLHRQVIHLLRDGRKIENGYQVKGQAIEMSRGSVSIDFKPQKEKILDLFKSMQQKLRSDADFTEEEKSLLGTSHFPVVSFITLMTQYKGSGSALILERASDLIAYETVLEFMEEAGRSIYQTAESLRAAQISGYELEAYIQQVGEVLTDLRNLKEENLQKIAGEQKALDSLIHIDRDLREKARTG